MKTLYRVDSSHPNKHAELYVIATDHATARGYVAAMLGVSLEQVLIAVYTDPPPVDSCVVQAHAA